MVRVADDVGVAAAVEHLVGLGHRRIVHVDGGTEPMAPDRRAGFLAASAGLPARVVPGGSDEAAGAAAARALLADLPTAVVTANDRSAIGLLDVFVRAGVRVPEDVSVVGFDDSSLARLAHIDLTTVSQEAPGQAARAVAAALERLDGGRVEPTESVLPPRLVVRGTTAPPTTVIGASGTPRRSRSSWCAISARSAVSRPRRCSTLVCTSATGPSPRGSSVRIVSCSSTYQPS